MLSTCCNCGANAAAAPGARRAAGFTLIELLVATGVLLVLLGLLIPTVLAAREQARVAHCASNLRTILAAHSLYRMTNEEHPVWVGKYGVKDHFSPDSGDSSVFIDSGTELLRYGKLLRFGAVQKEHFFCPSSPANEPGFGPGTFGLSVSLPLGSVYGTYAQRGVVQRGPAKRADWSKMIAVLTDFEYRDLAKLGYPTVLCHKRGLNAGYTDGHVQFVRGTFDTYFKVFGNDSFPGRRDGTWSRLDDAGGGQR